MARRADEPFGPSTAAARLKPTNEADAAAAASRSN